MEKLTCKKCSGHYLVEKLDQKNTNGTWVRYYKNGVKLATLLCYPCFRETINSRYPAIKKSYAKYERATKKGFLVRLYRNMLSRITGVQRVKYHLYKGKYLLPKEEFYSWALSQKKFHVMFEVWLDLGRPRKLTPSVDRVDSSRGYEVGNMEWVTHSENSRRGNLRK